MADYEELVELGFEGVDKFANTKYHDKAHDKIYPHLPAVPGWKKKQNKEEQKDLRKKQDKQDLNSQDRERQDQKLENRQEYQDRNIQQREQRQQQRQEPSSRHPDKGYSSPRPRSSRDDRYEYDPEMAFYAPGRRAERDFRSGNDDRYYEDERFYYKGSGAGNYTPRGAEDFNKSRSLAVAPYQAPQPQWGYDQRRDDYDRGRHAPERRRSSWSPPRSEKHGREGRDSHGSRARSRSKDKQHRIFATVGGALVGGFAGNQVRKGQKFDTAATIVGAIIGGVGAREASELWDDRRRKRDVKEEEWEEEFDDDRGNGEDRKRDDRYERDDHRREWR